MNTIPIYQVDAFATTLFSGNPAAVCPLESWLPDDVMQRLAAENNLSETAFFVKEGDGYHLRWFTPEFEIDLCGHATLASAFILFEHLQYPGNTVHFFTRSGLLKVDRQNDLIRLDFPARMPEKAVAPEALLKGLNIAPAAVYKSRDYFLVYDTEEQVKQIVPDFQYLNQLAGTVGVIVTAPAQSVDFVSRFFVPNSSIGEDPVTGSAHCNLIPYWSQQLQKTELVAKQLSARQGTLRCNYLGDRVTIAGKAVLYLKGECYV